MRNLICGLALALATFASAQTSRTLVAGTHASYWLSYDPHTLQNQSAVLMRAKDNMLQFLVFKCLNDGGLMSFITEFEPLFAEDGVYEMRESINKKYKVTYQIKGKNTVQVGKLNVVGYGRLDTRSLALDKATTQALLDAMETGNDVTFRIVPLAPVFNLYPGSSFVVPAAGFGQAFEAVNACDMG